MELSCDVCLLLQASKDLLMDHYSDLKDKPFFPSLIKYMSSGPVVTMVRVLHNRLLKAVLFEPEKLDKISRVQGKC